MPVMGLRTVAACIAAGYDGPQHIDEPWDYDFETGQAVWVRLSYSDGHNRARWTLGKVASKPFTKVADGAPRKHYKVSYPSKGGGSATGDFTTDLGGMKPDCYYIRELLKEELLWPIDLQINGH